VLDPDTALHDLQIAADLNPLSSAPGRVAGTLALRSHEYSVAESRFRQSRSNQPLGWLSWLGEGLAASQLGDRAAAHHDFVIADRINHTQPAVTQALAQVYTRHPLSPNEALQMLVVVQ
jgi:Flp pilus assembly protein TadD